MTRNLTRLLLRDVNDFLFDPVRRDAMERSLLDRLDAGGGPFVVVAHSQGTMVAYDVLRRLSRKQIEVPLFLTIGSPLGLTEVQDVIRQWTGGGLPFPARHPRPPLLGKGGWGLPGLAGEVAAGEPGA